MAGVGPVKDKWSKILGVSWSMPYLNLFSMSDCNVSVFERQYTVSDILKTRNHTLSVYIQPTHLKSPSSSSEAEHQLQNCIISHFS